MTQHLVRLRTAPGLAVKIQGTEHRLRAGSSSGSGRDPQSDIVLSGSRVSWNRAILRAEHDAWLIEDCGSTNGTFVASRKVARFEITEDCVLRLRDAADGPAISCSESRAVTPRLPPRTPPA